MLVNTTINIQVGDLLTSLNISLHSIIDATASIAKKLESISGLLISEYNIFGAITVAKL